MPDVKGYKLPNHDETYMYADAYAREELAKLPETYAPSGYGLGEHLPKEVDNWNDATKAGFYCSTGNSPDGTLWNGITLPRDGSLFTQIASRTYGYTTYICIRKHNQSWQPWEWLNPPMHDDIEYRTTERLGDKAVYTKLVNCGTAPNNTTKVVTLLPNSITVGSIARWSGYASYVGMALPSSNAGWKAEVVYQSGGYCLVLTTNKDQSKCNVYVQVWYTKG